MKTSIGGAGVISASLADAGQTTLPPGMTATLPADKLRNHFDNHLYIDAIRFQFVQSVTGGTFPQGVIKTRIYAGRQELTQGATTLASLCVCQDRLDEFALDGSALGEPTPGNTNPLLFTWYFPRPLFFPRGESFQIQLISDTSAPGAPTNPFNGRNLTGTLGAMTSVALIGRETDEEPEAINIPHASAFQAPFTRVNGTGNVVYVNSPNSVMINPHKFPLFVRGINGVIVRASSSGLVATSLGEFVLSTYASVQINKSASKERLAASTATFLAREYVPWGNLFNPQTRELRLNTALGPHSLGFQTKTRLDFSNALSTLKTSNQLYQVQHCMVGYYKAPTAELWPGMAARHHGGF